MKSKSQRIILIPFLALFSACALISSEPRLTADEALALADAYAAQGDAKFSERKFKVREAMYLEKRGRWFVKYIPDPWLIGGDFTVYIDDKTGEAELWGGM